MQHFADKCCILSYTVYIGTFSLFFIAIHKFFYFFPAMKLINQFQEIHCLFHPAQYRGNAC